MKKNGLWILCTITFLLSAGCGKKQDVKDEVKKPMPVVEVVRAEKRDLSKKIIFTGSVEPVKLARIASPAEGPVMECLTREGDAVKKGQRLAKIGRNRIAETGLDSAREELRRQEADFKRIEQLVKNSSLPGEQLDIAKVNLKRAEAQVAAMETGAGDYEITSPWDGLVSRVWIADGNYVSPRAPLIEIYDPESFVVRFSIPEQNSLAIQPGQPVQATLDAYPGKTFAGSVTRVYPELDRLTRTMTAEAVLNEKMRLLSGMFARVSVEVEKKINVIAIPESALIPTPGGETLVFVLEGETVTKRKVKTSIESDKFVAIENGIEAGETVVIRGNEQLKDGSKVQIKDGKKKPEGDIKSKIKNKKENEF